MTADRMTADPMTASESHTADAPSRASPRQPQWIAVPPTANRALCRGCGAPVWWIVTARNRRMPVDVLTTGGLAPDVAAGTAGRGVSHFATCAHAARFRRPRGAA